MPKTQFTQSRLSPKRLLGAIVALTVAFLLLTSVISVASKYVATKRHIKELAQEKAALEQKQVTLKSKNDYLATAEGAEQVLREKYNVIKPGEGIVVVADTPVLDTDITPSRARRWWDAILSGVGIKRE